MSEPHVPAETPDLYGEFPRLSDAQIAFLTTMGERRTVPARQVLVPEGSRTCDFYVVLDGMAAFVEGHGTPEERVLGIHGPGRFLGERACSAARPSPTASPWRSRERCWPSRPGGCRSW